MHIFETRKMLHVLFEMFEFGIQRWHSMMAVVCLCTSTGAAVAAPDYDYPYLHLFCDVDRQQLIIEERVADSRENIRGTPSAIDLHSLLRLMPLGKEDGIMETIDVVTAKCELNHAKYQIRIEPYLFNRKIQGMCGAAHPTISLTMLRNHTPLLRGLKFRGQCIADDTFSHDVLRIMISERDGMVVFTLAVKNGMVEKMRKINELPKLNRTKLFD